MQAEASVCGWECVLTFAMRGSGMLSLYVIFARLLRSGSNAMCGAYSAGLIVPIRNLPFDCKCSCTRYHDHARFRLLV